MSRYIFFYLLLNYLIFEFKVFYKVFGKSNGVLTDFFYSILLPEFEIAIYIYK